MPPHRHMRALVWEGPRMVRVSQCAVPSPRPGEVLIRSVAAALCGTDLHLYEGAFAPAIPPLILGHEVAGIVVEHTSSRGPSSLKAGDRVTVNPTVGCGACAHCRAHRANHCRDRETM